MVQKQQTCENSVEQNMAEMKRRIIAWEMKKNGLTRMDQ